MISYMDGEEKLSDEYSYPMLRSTLQILFLFILRECGMLEEMPADITTTDREVVLAARFIHAHYMEDISAKDISAFAGYSSSYLSYKFKRVVGIGIHRYLMYTRLRTAARELLTTGDTITEIACRCGFSSSNYFKDAFREQYGVSPRAYRCAAGIVK